MKSLNEWREDQIDEVTDVAPSPMNVVKDVMSQIAPIIINAHQQIEAWPEEREKRAARRTLDSQLLKASRDQWMGKAKMAVNQMSHGMDATRALNRFGGVSRTAASQLMNQ